MPAPLIGITTSEITHAQGFPFVGVAKPYIHSVTLAGGAPVLVPLGLPLASLEVLVARLDGVLFTGGGDIHPDRFQGTAHVQVNGISQERDDLELELFEQVVADRKPFFGICRGIQLVNVALGGDLYTHILDQHPGALEHSYYPNWPRNHLAHSVSVRPNSRLASILAETQPSVNSLHHQGINRLAHNLLPAAYAPDGLVEAVELEDYPFGLAVQWHPEWLQDQEAMRRLFRAFVTAAGGDGDQAG